MFARLGVALASVAASAVLVAPVAQADPPVRVDARVLVLDDQQGQVGTFLERLRSQGVPTTVIDVSDSSRDPITAESLRGTDAQGVYGKYSAVVIQTDYPAEVNGDELTALYDYEMEYSARELITYTWAHPEVGVSYAENPGFTGELDGMQGTVTEAAKGLGFGYLNGPLPLRTPTGRARTTVRSPGRSRPTPTVRVTPPWSRCRSLTPTKPARCWGCSTTTGASAWSRPSPSAVGKQSSRCWLRG